MIRGNWSDGNSDNELSMSHANSPGWLRAIKRVAKIKLFINHKREMYALAHLNRCQPPALNV